MATKTVTDASFQNDVLGASGPVLVDFWAEWCGPCKMIAPALEEISDEMGEKVTVAKLNIDDNPDAPANIGLLRNTTKRVFMYGEPAAAGPRAMSAGLEPLKRLGGRP